MSKFDKFRKGDKLRALNSIRYFLGQSSSDKIERNEIVTVDTVNKHGQLQFVEHADRYGPFSAAHFVLVAADGKHIGKGRWVVFDGKWGKIVDKDKSVQGPHIVHMVQIAFEDGTKSWEVEDDDKMGRTPESKAKIDKLVQVIKSAKNPRSEFYRTINHLLK